ncbi:MAG: hypothetical protein WCK16_00155 [Candidatus Moraniibacteriota bacterium]
MKNLVAVFFCLLAMVFVPAFAGSSENQMWVSTHNYSYTQMEMPSGISMTAEMTATEFVMTIRGVDSLTTYLRLNLPTGTSSVASPGGPQTIARRYGYIDAAGKFKKNSAGDWEISVPKVVLCQDKSINAFFPALMMYDEKNPSQQTEVELYPNSEYFKLGNGLKTGIVNHGMAMMVDCQ